MATIDPIEELKKKIVNDTLPYVKAMENKKVSYLFGLVINSINDWKKNPNTIFNLED